MPDPGFGLPERQRIGPKRPPREAEASRLREYAAACRSARYWIEGVTEAFADGDADELQRLLNFRDHVLDRIDEALNPGEDT